MRDFQLIAAEMTDVKELAQPPGLALQVREEQMQLRPDLTATISGDVLNEMTYSRQVVKEVLRYRPPAPMVPQVRDCPFHPTLMAQPKAVHASMGLNLFRYCRSSGWQDLKRDMTVQQMVTQCPDFSALTLLCVSVQITQREFQLTEDFTAPKGALLMPSLIASSMQVSLKDPRPCACREAAASVPDGATIYFHYRPDIRPVNSSHHDQSSILCRHSHSQSSSTQTASARSVRRTSSSSAIS